MEIRCGFSAPSSGADRGRGVDRRPLDRRPALPRRRSAGRQFGHSGHGGYFSEFFLVSFLVLGFQ